MSRNGRGRWDNGRWDTRFKPRFTGRSDAASSPQNVQYHGVILRPDIKLIQPKLFDDLHTEEGKKRTLQEFSESLKITQLALQRLLSLVKNLRRADGAGAIVRPPGTGIRAVCEFLFSRKTLARVIDPILADMQVEHFEALHTKRPWKANWILMRGHFVLAKTILVYSPLKTIYELCRRIGVGG